MKNKTAQRQPYQNITKKSIFLSAVSSKTYQKISKDNFTQHICFCERTALFQPLPVFQFFSLVSASKHSFWQKIKRKISPLARQKNSIKLLNFSIAN